MKKPDALTKKEVLLGAMLRAMRTGWHTFKKVDGVSVEMRISPTKVSGDFKIETCPLAILGLLDTRGTECSEHFVWWNPPYNDGFEEILWNILREQEGFLRKWLSEYFFCIVTIPTETRPTF